MNSYDKKKATIEIYELMKDNIEVYIREVSLAPENYVPEKYRNVPKISQDIQDVLTDFAKRIHDEITTRMLEIYRL